MIQAQNIVKYFGKNRVLSDLNCEIAEGSIYGLIGANGVGKSTFLRLISGCYTPESGKMLVDGEEVFDNIPKKENVVYVSDDFYIPSGATVDKVAKMYAVFYEDFDMGYFAGNCQTLNLPLNGKLSAFSKGMKRQVIMLAALACKTKYILFDETFDGLDPVVRNHMKNLIYAEVADRGTTVVMTSHNLRELEDICDHLGVLHKGGILFEGDINNIKSNIYKVQIVFDREITKEMFKGFNVLEFSKSGSVAKLIIKGDQDEDSARLRAMNPLIMDILPLTLEEIFIYEMEVLGYAFRNDEDK